MPQRRMQRGRWRSCRLKSCWRRSLVRRNGVTARIPVFPTTVADTTGAGDSYAGAFLYGYLQGWTPAQCGELGSRVAALTVGQVGAVALASGQTLGGPGSGPGQLQHPCGVAIDVPLIDTYCPFRYVDWIPTPGAPRCTFVP